MRITTFLALSSLTLFGCRSDSSNNTDGNNGGDGSGSNGGSLSIKDVQNDAMSPGTQVSLHGVIVTAIDKYGAKTGDFWIEDADGGAYSGVHVFGAQTSDVAGLALGDVIDISGAEKAEFALTSDTTGRTVTELEPVSGGQITISKTGSGQVPAPQMVDALAIGMLAETSPPSATSPRSMEWEKWEGVLITVTNVQALNNPGVVGTTDPTLENFGITGDAMVESSLAQFPVDASMKDIIKSGDCLGGVTGVVDYFFDYLVLPRQTSEIMTGGTACPVENTSALCGDGMDNDGNGFTDCADNACVVAASTCRQTSTVSAINTAATLPTNGVELDDVYVLAVSFNKKNLWVSDTLTSAQNKGIYISYGQTLDANIVAGAKVSVIGRAKDYNNDTMGDAEREIQAISVTFGTAPTTPPVAIAKTAAELSADHSYVGELVTLTNVSTVSVLDATHFVNNASQKVTTVTTNFLTDDDIVRITDAPPYCYATITGIWTYQVFNNGYAILPTVLGTKTAGACP